MFDIAQCNSKRLDIKPTYISGGVPVFTPTMEQFKDFYAFNKSINQYGMQTGIVKVIPPTEWVSLVSECYTLKNMDTIKIKNPIVQNVNSCSQGVYTVQNIEKHRSYNIHQWKKLAETLSHSPPTTRARKGLNEDDRKNPAPNSRQVFTAERCEDLEKNYWRTITYAEPMYGADVLGSLFTNDIVTWNISTLPNILDLMDEKVPGVNDAYLYAGLWKASFAWHLEDQDLHSINYIHFGAPKQWYLISQKDRIRFFNVMRDTFNDEYRHCSQFLRHKTFMVSPQFLSKHGIECNKIVHYPNEFMITYPYGYHAGFNYGYNLAESVNFAIDDWFPIGDLTEKCECVPFSVAIDVDRLKQKFYTMCGIKIESTDSSIHSTKTRKPQTSRDISSKRPRSVLDDTRVSLPGDCCLCPFTLSEQAKAMPLFSILSGRVGSATVNVHRLCAIMFQSQISVLDSGAHVSGIDSISRDQRNLRCCVCKYKDVFVTPGSSQPHLLIQSACYQCDHPKCTRLFHGICGFMDGVEYDIEKGTGTCRFHRKTLHNLVDFCKQLKPDSWIQFAFGKLCSCGMVVENNESEQSVIAKIYPAFIELIEVPYKGILVPNPQIRDIGSIEKL